MTVLFIICIVVVALENCNADLDRQKSRMGWLDNRICACEDEFFGFGFRQLMLTKARGHYWCGAGLSRGGLRPQKASGISQRASNPRVHKIRLGRMGSNFCKSDVDQSLHLPPSPHSHLESSDQTPSGRNCLSDLIQCHIDSVVNSAMPTCSRSMGQDHSRKTFPQNSTTKDYSRTSRYGLGVPSVT